MGYVFDFNDAKAYEKWFNSSQNRFAADLESQLMVDMLNPTPRETLLDIGCGIGTSLAPFIEKNLNVTGIDPSPYMLDISLKNLGKRADLYRGFAEDLPFDDNSFNFACLVTTLEFVDDPQKAIEEACRVAKDRVFIGVLNKYAIKGIERRVRGIFTKTIFNHARFFSVLEMKQIIRTILGQVPVSWRTVCQLPAGSGKIAHNIEKSRFIQRFPFGAFAGIVVTLVPRFRTRPLAMRHQQKHRVSTVAG